MQASNYDDSHMSHYMSRSKRPYNNQQPSGASYGAAIRPDIGFTSGDLHEQSLGGSRSENSTYRGVKYTSITRNPSELSSGRRTVQNSMSSSFR